MLFESVVIYFISISVVSFLACRYDKFASKRGMRRISEKNLIILSLLGGSAAMYITMCIIRHKIKHNKFMIGLPVIILFQTAVLVLLATRFL